MKLNILFRKIKPNFTIGVFLEAILILSHKNCVNPDLRPLLPPPPRPLPPRQLNQPLQQHQDSQVHADFILIFFFNWIFKSFNVSTFVLSRSS